MTHVIGVDLGGTKTAAALVDSRGGLGAVYTAPTSAQCGPDAVLDTVAELVRAVLADANLTATQLAGVGVGSAGVIDAETGVVLSATDALPGWTGTDIGQGIRSRLAATPENAAPVNSASGNAGHENVAHENSAQGSLRVTVANDVDAHAAGEAWLGAAAGARIALMVAVGTGVGGAIVLNGAPLRGARSLAGEMGHMPAPGADDLRCGCGRLGHVEALGSGPALHRHFLALGGDASCADTREVLVSANSGDGIALQAVHDSATIVGRATAALVTMVDPDVVVVGGGLVGAGPLWWNAMETALRAELIEPFAALPVVSAKLGGTAAILGAARRAWHDLETRHDLEPEHDLETKHDLDTQSAPTLSEN